MKYVNVDTSFAPQILCMPVHELEYYSTIHSRLQTKIAMSKVAHVWFKDALDCHLRMHLYLDKRRNQKDVSVQLSAPRNNAKASRASSDLLEVMMVEMWLLGRS